jgi:hypothetical protein
VCLVHRLCPVVGSGTKRVLRISIVKLFLVPELKGAT